MKTMEQDKTQYEVTGSDRSGTIRVTRDGKLVRTLHFSRGSRAGTGGYSYNISDGGMNERSIRASSPIQAAMLYSLRS